jgi:hypothetical protein
VHRKADENALPSEHACLAKRREMGHPAGMSKATRLYQVSEEGHRVVIF